jgi:hypothetical protein
MIEIDYYRLQQLFSAECKKLVGEARGSFGCGPDFL